MLTAALLLQILAWVFVTANIVLCALSLYAGGRLHAIDGRENYRHIPDAIKRAIMLCFSVPIGTALVWFAWPTVFRGGTPFALAAMMLCAVGATVGSMFFVVGVLKTFTTKRGEDAPTRDSGERRAAIEAAVNELGGGGNGQDDPRTASGRHRDMLTRGVSAHPRH
jgi:hypothetical protein